MKSVILILAAVALANADSDAAKNVLKRRAMLQNKKKNLHGRTLAVCSGGSDWACVDGTTCRKVKEDAAGYECTAYAASGAYCEASEHCADPLRCHENKCAEQGAAGAECDPYDDTRGTGGGWAGAYPTQQCKTGYCGKESTFEGKCVAYKAVGETCDENVDCDIAKAHCNVVGGEKKCSAYKKTGEACTSDEECGGDNPPNSWGSCSDTEKKCTDVGADIAEAVGTAIGMIIGIIVAVIVIFIILCYCACCRNKNKVVVVQQ